MLMAWNKLKWQSNRSTRIFLTTLMIWLVCRRRRKFIGENINCCWSDVRCCSRITRELWIGLCFVCYNWCCRVFVRVLMVGIFPEYMRRRRLPSGIRRTSYSWWKGWINMAIHSGMPLWRWKLSPSPWRAQAASTRRHRLPTNRLTSRTLHLKSLVLSGKVKLIRYVSLTQNDR